ncbi:hypothetical protein [Arsenicicoccus sp. oral taxon 190]|uniref:hypothetical protein n=1 Tax=Arsenicicoccus sp. oral taxon 190 TaxID=1658671 RepID=UPI00067A038D|nr:hypothetical protein [Arsenicicoccus sp. oral taxon 190]AKT51174.1 hypothetical protein ADJ73_07345 [Arsenicicoccus sp. oral taxon 190]
MSPRTRRPLALVLAVGAAASVSGCTALSTGYAPPVTVTVTPTVTVTAKTAPTTAAPTPTPTPTATRNPDLRSAVRGRAFDLGTITSVDQQGGNQVIVLDRWTVRGRSDGSVGRTGIDLTPSSGASFSNRNAISFRIPVDPAAQIVRQTCTSPDAPAATAKATLQDLQALPDQAAIVKITLDDQGWATKVESNPVCP